MTLCVAVGGTKTSEDHRPKVPTTGCFINPNTAVRISQYNDKYRESYGKSQRKIQQDATMY